MFSLKNSPFMRKWTARFLNLDAFSLELSDEVSTGSGSDRVSAVRGSCLQDNNPVATAPGTDWRRYFDFEIRMASCWYAS